MVTSDASTGNYSISDLPAGTYTLEAVKTGWNTSTETISLGSNTTLNFSLWPTSWEVIHIGGCSTIESITSVESLGKLFAVGDGGQTSFILSSSDGLNWQNLSSPTNEALVTVQGLGPYGVGVINKNGGLFYSTEESTWNYFANLTSEAIRDAYILDPSSWEVITESGKVVQTLDSGGSFRNITPPLDHQYYALQGYGPILIVVGANGSAFFTSECTGVSISWSQFNITTEALTSFFWDFSNKAIAGTQTGAIYVSTDQGSSFAREVDGIPYPITAATGGGNIFIVGGGNGLILKRTF